MGMVAKLRHYIPRRLLLNIYHTLIAPYLKYGICACGWYFKNFLVTIETRQFPFFG